MGAFLYFNMASGGKWSTKRVAEILKEIEATGVIPRNNPFYERDLDLRAPKLNWEYTNEELIELGKIKKNILYFGETYAKVMTDEGNRVVTLRKYQKNTLLQLQKYRFNVWLASRQIGKCVTFDTEVSIHVEKTDGYVTMPIFEAHYAFKESLSFLDKVEYKLFKILYRIKKRMDYIKS